MTEERLLEALEAWNSHDVDQVLHYMAEGSTYHASVGPEEYGRTYSGLSEVRDGVQQFFAKYPDGRFVDTQVFLSGDRGSAEWSFVATGSDGSQRQVRGCDLLEFEGELIATKNAFRKQAS